MKSIHLTARGNPAQKCSRLPGAVTRRRRPPGTTWRAQTRRRQVRSRQRHEVLPVVSDSVLGDGAIGRG